MLSSVIAASRLRQVKTPSFLSLEKNNFDYLQNITSFLYTDSFFIEIEFEYDSYDQSFAGVLGQLFQGNLRLLIDNNRIIINVVGPSNITYNINTSFGQRLLIRLSRNTSNDVFIKVNNNPEVNIANIAGTLSFTSIGNVDNKDRLLDGRVYYLNANGDEFNLEEGSGNTITGSLGGQFEIKTNSTDPNYIDNQIWQQL